MYSIHNYNFKPDTLILICNPSLEMNKTKPQYYSLILVIQQTCNGTYQLAELDGTVFKLCYAAFYLLSYYAYSPTFIPVICIIDHEDLASVIADDLHTQEEQQAVTMPEDGQI